jgi:hypothetical protein
MQNYKLETEFKKTELTGRSPLKRRRSAMDCSANEEEQEDQEEQEDDERATKYLYRTTVKITVF